MRAKAQSGSVLAMLAVAVVYVATAKLGLELSVAYSNVTPVWAPTGISLAALLLLGRRAWPGVAVGAFVTNVTTEIPVWTAGVIAMGNTLAAFVGALLLERVAHFRVELDRVRDILSLVLYAAVISTAISASVGTAALLIAGEIVADNLVFAWQLWWLGDMTGVILVAPLILTWARWRSEPRRHRYHVWEEVVVFGGLVAASWLVFFGGQWRYPSILFPLVVFAAARFRQRGAATAALILTAIAIAGTLQGSVPIPNASLTTSIQILQTLASVVAVTTLILAAILSERESAERRLAETVALLEATLDSTNDAIIVVDLEGEIVRFNQRFIDLWSLPADVVNAHDPDKIRGHVYARLEDPVAFRARVESIQAEPNAPSTDLIQLADGRVLERHSQAQVVDGQPVGRVWSFRDITGARRVEEARRRFINDAAHELRTPIAAIRGFVDVLVQNRVETGDVSEEVVAAIVRQSDRLQALVSRMLDFGRMESRDRHLDLGTIDLVEAVDAAVEAIPAPEGTKTSIVIDPDIKVFADRVALEQVVTNLLVNAFRYGGDRVSVTGEAVDGRAVIGFSDNGPGVSPGLAATLFEPFTRGPKASDGAGLGLAIVRSLLGAMGGEVRYESRPEGGATFVVTLPLAGRA